MLGNVSQVGIYFLNKAITKEEAKISGLMDEVSQNRNLVEGRSNANTDEVTSHRQTNDEIMHE